MKSQLELTIDENGILNKVNVVPQSVHKIDVQKISGNALKVLEKLAEAGFEAYLVGGGVRDLLLEMQPKDFDISTNASPEQVMALFSNCRLIGRRFRLAHILFGREVIEVATFRADHQQGEGGEVEADGRILRDNVFGSVEEDALRRDFSVNALYYSWDDSTVIDYVGALEDLHDHTLRLIGEPLVRLAEDPVRGLRAIRFAAKLGFSIDSGTAAAIHEQAGLLRNIPPARLFEEVLKIFHSGHAVESLNLLREFDLLQYLFPDADRQLKSGDEDFKEFVYRALSNTDTRILSGKPVTPAFLYAVMLWSAVREKAAVYMEDEPPVPAILLAADEVTAKQLSYTSLPKRFSLPMREIWAMQPRLERYIGKRALRLLEGARFRAGYDFLCLRAAVNQDLQEKCRWWTDIQETNPVGTSKPAEPRKSQKSRRSSSRRRKAKE
ncbi:MAG: polynucleotide adenylyltransferase PcnB [Gammaproteobacteria bacterium]|nr:polynucleotide adenylyltransferase PcnB [Gammaproteobacteria bacterium]